MDPARNDWLLLPNLQGKFENEMSGRIQYKTQGFRSFVCSPSVPNAQGAPPPLDYEIGWAGTILLGVWHCVKGICKPPVMAESLVRSWKLACIVD